MKKSILLKFSMIFIFFSIFGFMLINYFAESIVYNRLLEQNADRLKSYCDFIADNIYNPENGSLSSIDYSGIFSDKIQQAIDCNLLILDSKNKLIFSSDNLGNKDSSDLIIKDFNTQDYDSPYWQISNLYNLYRTDSLSVVQTIKNGKSTIGYVLFYIPTSDIKKQSQHLTIVFNVTYGIILGLSLIIFFIFYRIFYIPLKQIRNAALEYAKGNFGYSGLSVNSNDELGDVANSLKYMSKQLSDSIDYQKQFISNISHDFRSPLTSIKGYLEAMIDGTIPPEDHSKYLEIVLSESNRLEKLTDGLRDLNSWNTSGPQLIFEEFDMEKIINSTVDTFQGSCEKKHIELILQFPPTHCNVYADKGRIEQVLYNLLDNAIKFSNQHSKIIIKLSNKGDKQYCSVKDFGMGIPSDSLEKIWQRFYKTDLSRGRDKTGSGIGLAIVKEIIMAHNETIDVISTEGVGTEFVFSIKKAK